MSREIVRERALYYLEEALKKNKATDQAYNDLLKLNYTEDQAKEYLAFLLENFLKRNQLEDDKDETRLWEEQLKNVYNDLVSTGDEPLTSYKLEKLPQKARKEILSLNRDFETESNEMLNDLETAFASNLFDLYTQYDLSSKDGRKIVTLAIASLYGKHNNIEYDVFEVAHIDEVLLADKLLQKMDINNEEFGMDLDQTSLDYGEQLLMYDFFILALYGLYRTIELCDKTYGTNAFFKSMAES